MKELKNLKEKYKDKIQVYIGIEADFYSGFNPKLDENLGLDIRIINEQDVAEYKLEHICRKLQEWFRSEIESISYQIISEEERTLKAKIYITHKEHNVIEKEVIIGG